jgi:WD40 repeat protein
MREILLDDFRCSRFGGSVVRTRGRRSLVWGPWALAALLLCGWLSQAITAEPPERPVQSGPGRLDPAAVPREERFEGQPPELVAVIGHRSRRSGSMPECAAYSPDGKILATGGWFGDPAITLWDAATMRRRATFGGRAVVYHLAFSSDGKTLASCERFTDVLRLWDVTGPRPWERAHYEIPKDGRLWRVVFAPDAPLLAAANGTEGVRLLDVSQSPPKQTALLKNPCGVVRLGFVGSGKALAAVGLDGALRLWDLSGPRPRVAWSRALGVGANSLAFTPDGKVLAVGRGDAFSIPGGEGITSGGTTLWRVGAGGLKEWATVPAGKPGRIDDLGAVQQVAFSGDGRSLVFASYSGAYTVCDVSGPKPRVRCTLDDFTATPEHLPEAPPAFALSADGNHLATVGRPDHEVRVWDLSGTRPRQVFPEASTDPWLYARVRFSPDGKTLATWRRRMEADCQAKGEVVLWDLGAKVPARRAAFAFNDKWMDPMSFSPDGQTLATCGYSDGNIIRLWDVRGIAPFCRARVTLPRGEISLIHEFSPVGNALASTGNEIVWLWDVGEREPKKGVTLEKEPYAIRYLAFSPDGKLLGEGSSAGAFRFWRLDGDTSHPAGIVENTGIFNLHPAFSHDGGSLACVGTLYNEYKLWVAFYDFSGKQPKRRRQLKVTGNEGWGAFTRVAFTPDDRRLLLMTDKEILVLDAESGKELFRRQLEGCAQDADFAPDGRHVAVVNGNGTVYILRLPDLADTSGAK